MSFTLLSGKTITDMSTPATSADCLPYQCGADSGNTLALQWCALSGQAAAFPCSDVQCAPYAGLLNCDPPALPAIATAAPPTVQPELPVLTPANITQPLPDITAAVAPTPIVTPSDSLWCVLNGAIAENPMLAVLALAGVAVLLWPKGGR